MKLTYIYHSGYAIEGEGFTILIDYYKDSVTADEGLVHEELLKKGGRLYVLCTHSHHDHFNPEILQWKNERPDIIYVFSKELLLSGTTTATDAIYLDKLEVYTDNLLSVKAYGSTDLGGSFLIQIENKTIFHAGDLNNWHWNQESTPEEIEEAETYYAKELNLLATDVKHLNLAMFPVDPRLGKDYMKGAQQFVDTIKTDIFVPMHFGEAYDKAAAFAVYAKKDGTDCVCWKHRGESINF